MREDVTRAIARRDEVVARVRQVLIEGLGVRRAPDEIDPDAPLFGTGLGLDSIDAVELVVGLEARFSINFPQGYMHRRFLRTVGTLADAVITILDAPPEADEP